MAQSLPTELSQREVQLRNEAAMLKKELKFSEAEERYLAAWNILPNPKHNWDSSQSILKSLVRFYFEIKNYFESEKWAREIFKCDILPGDAVPYIILGKVFFESGQIDLAREFLIKAFEIAGRRGFVGEDPKYLKFAQEKMRCIKE